MASGRRRVHASCRTRRSLGIEPRAKREEWAGRVVGKVEYPAPSMRVWYNPKRTVPRLPGQHLFSYRKPGCPLKHIPAALLSKAVRHSLLAKLTIPITTVKSAHTAMIVWASIASPIRSKPPGRRSAATIVPHAERRPRLGAHSEAGQGAGRVGLWSLHLCRLSAPA